MNFCFWENESILQHEIRRELKNIGIDIERSFSSDEDLNKTLRAFGEELLKLNIIAFYDRYNHIDEIKKEIKEAISEYAYEDTPFYDRQRIQVLKSIECFLYQCAEGEIPEKSSLYKALENIAGHIKSNIINKIPEYEKAIWG